MKLQLIGWGLFILCSIFYIISSLHMQDWFYLAGSIVFLIACIIFMLALLKKKNDKDDKS